MTFLVSKGARVRIPLLSIFFFFFVSFFSNLVRIAGIFYSVVLTISKIPSFSSPLQILPFQLKDVP